MMKSLKNEWKTESKCILRVQKSTHTLRNTTLHTHTGGSSTHHTKCFKHSFLRSQEFGDVCKAYITMFCY